MPGFFPGLLPGPVPRRDGPPFLPGPPARPRLPRSREPARHPPSGKQARYAAAPRAPTYPPRPCADVCVARPPAAQGPLHGLPPRPVPAPRADGRRQPPGLPRRAAPGRRAAGYAQSPPQRVAFLPEPISLQEFILHFRRAAWQSRQEARRPPFHGAAAVLCSPQIPATGFACRAAGAAGRDGGARVRVNFHNKKFSALFVC